MSPLAAEILTDLDLYFPEGATFQDLKRWLGEPVETLAPTLFGLCLDGVLDLAGFRYHPIRKSGHLPHRTEARGRKKPIVRDEMHFRRLLWRHGPERTKAILSGRDEATNADVQAWRQLGAGR